MPSRPTASATIPPTIAQFVSMGNKADVSGNDLLLHWEDDPAVGVILEAKIGQKIDAGTVLCRLYHTKEDRLEEAAQMVEDAFRISAQPPEERILILEVVG